MIVVTWHERGERREATQHGSSRHVVDDATRATTWIEGGVKETREQEGVHAQSGVSRRQDSTIVGRGGVKSTMSYRSDLQRSRTNSQFLSICKSNQNRCRDESTQLLPAPSHTPTKHTKAIAASSIRAATKRATPALILCGNIIIVTD